MPPAYKYSDKKPKFYMCTDVSHTHPAEAGFLLSEEAAIADL